MQIYLSISRRIAGSFCFRRHLGSSLVLPRPSADGVKRVHSGVMEHVRGQKRPRTDGFSFSGGFHAPPEAVGGAPAWRSLPEVSVLQEAAGQRDERCSADDVAAVGTTCDDTWEMYQHAKYLRFGRWPRSITIETAWARLKRAGVRMRKAPKDRCANHYSPYNIKLCTRGEWITFGISAHCKKRDRHGSTPLHGFVMGKAKFTLAAAVNIRKYVWSGLEIDGTHASASQN